MAGLHLIKTYSSDSDEEVNEKDKTNDDINKYTFLSYTLTVDMTLKCHVTVLSKGICFISHSIIIFIYILQNNLDWHYLQVFQHGKELHITRK